jgi:penicillin-binding protein 1A
LIESYNIPAIKVLGKVGLKPVHGLAGRVGISSDLPPDLSLALGAVDVSPLEMTAAYLPFVCDGRYRQPTLIQRIVNAEGKEIYRDGGSSSQVVSPAAAAEIKELLVRVISEGTGKKAKGLAGVSGGKTGTSDESRDAWFIGFNRDLISGVWLGHDRNQSLGDNENGGMTAAPVWLEFMRGLN